MRNVAVVRDQIEITKLTKATANVITILIIVIIIIEVNTIDKLTVIIINNNRQLNIMVQIQMT
jgi:hypothetical protein